MDTLGALALATGPPTDQLMRKHPVGRREPLITNIMWRNVIAQALFQVIVLLTLTFKGNDILKLKHYKTGRADLVRNTVIFNAFVFCQIFNEFNSRKPDQKNIFEGLLSSHLFIGIISITLVLQVLIVEFAGKIASTTPLDWEKWIVCIVIGFISWPLAAIAKFIPVPEKPFLDYCYCSPRKSTSGHGSSSHRKAEVD
uniref:Cation-transporting P-type ATPase C-terminal domain-containing protein n=1 Tax=Picea sitchensis TaxID=3332 RepID=D5A955_PICSI|nr:unknown [Picea sitchensis]